MSTITWLHLSDLHFRTDGAHAWDEDIVLRALLDDVRQQRAEGQAPDFITITGDLAFSGKPAEYDLAGRFFDDLLAATGLGKDRLFPVPGNHDVDRGRISRGARGIAAALTDRRSANEVLANDADRRLMLARFAGYAAFVDGYLGGHLAFDDKEYFYVHSLELAGQRIDLLGLNSAWLAQGGDEDRGHLLLGERQTRTALDQAKGADLSLALLHHPFDWLRDFDRGDSEAMLTDRVDFILHGHMHQIGLLQARGPDSNAFIIAAGACYETRQHPNAYNLVQLDLASGQGAVHLRTYSDRRGGFWTKDVMNYRNVPDGVYNFALRDDLQPAPAAGGAGTVRAGQGSAAATGRGVAQTGNGNVAITGDVQGGVTIVQGDYVDTGGGAYVEGGVSVSGGDFVGRDSVAQPVVAPGGPPAAREPQAAATGARGYDLAAVRDLLLAAFTAQGLRRLFLYTANAELRELTQEFGPSDGLATMVDKTIEFCRVEDLLPDLLLEVEGENSRQYARFADRLRR